MRRLVLMTVIVLLTLTGLILLYEFRHALLIFVLSLAMAAVFRPLIRRLRKAGAPKILSILLPYIFGLGTLGVLLYYGGAQLLEEIGELSEEFAQNYVRFRESAEDGTVLQQTIAEQLPPVEVLFESITGEQGQALARSLLGFASDLAGFISQMAIMIVLSVYWSIDETHFERLWLSVLSAKNRPRVRSIWRGIEGGVGAYIRSEVVQSLLAAILLGLLYSFIGLPYPVLLAVIGALLWLIPWVGAVLAMAPPLLLGFITGPLVGIVAGVTTLVVLLVMEIVIEPRLFNRQRYSSLLIVLLLIALADAYGLIGILVAPPLAAAIQIFFSNILSQPEVRPLPSSNERISLIRERLTAIRERAGDMNGESPYMDSILDRLDKLVAKAEVALNQPQAGSD